MQCTHVITHIFSIFFQCIAIRAEHVAKKTELTEKIEKLHSAISALCPNKTLTSIDNIIAQHGKKNLIHLKREKQK